MTGMCCEVVGETEAPSHVETSGGRQTKRRRMEIHQLKLLAADAIAAPLPESRIKRKKLEKGVETKAYDIVITRELQKEIVSNTCDKPLSEAVVETPSVHNESRFGLTTVCGRRRDMEDAVAVQPLFHDDMHFYGVYDGHGCSHVAVKCKDRMHEIVKSELENGGACAEWKETMAKSFSEMDKEVTKWGEGDRKSNCRCELQTPQCDTVGSTAVVAMVTPDKIVVSNCGDSRAVLCRNGTAIPLSLDHKPDRPDELARIEEAGGRVIYWDGARVMGVLAMSRAIGDNYLKPCVIPEPEVTVTERTSEDECLILASDGLWDVVSNDVACGVARMCLNSQNPPSPVRSPGSENVAGGESSDKACSDASVLLTKLALARRSSDNVSVVVVDLRKIL